MTEDTANFIAGVLVGVLWSGIVAGLMLILWKLLENA